MKTNNTKKLIEILKLKGINFSADDCRKFRRYNYYQTINAYKNLFISGCDSLDDIKKNIFSNRKIDFYRKMFKIKPEVLDSDLYEKICDEICKKYGISANSLVEKEEAINFIKYHLHLYPENVYYDDFIRMYKFEHELRTMLLKYTLIIEESMKNEFVSYLNDKGASADYLINMSNYDTSAVKNKAFETMKLIIGKHENYKSIPIKTKRKQNLIVPYWILVNELAMNQTYYAIANLNKSDSNAIFLKCTTLFTKLNVQTLPSDNAQRKVNTFKSILFYLGEFRNMLAHNQPIYCYNIEKFNVNLNERFEYELPNTKNDFINKSGKTVSKHQQQINMNGNLIYNLKDFFGSDNYLNKNYANLNLSLIVYMIYKILKNIDKNTKFYEELIQIYGKYNIIINNSHNTIKDLNKCEKLLTMINELASLDFDSNKFIAKIDSGQVYKRDLKKWDSDYNKLKQSIIIQSNKIEITNVISKYKIFPAMKRYSDFTGIDINFFNDIK